MLTSKLPESVHQKSTELSSETAGIKVNAVNYFEENFIFLVNCFMP